jgi:pSer/pThr/pTyr-binding forkhead associated (FHA) protein
MAIADRSTRTDVPTQETGSLPRIPERDRQRAFARVPRLAPGRYLAIEDAGDVVLMALTADVTHLGRSPAADIVLDDASVSRRHAVVARRGENTVILDNRSLNGVRVNGERVGEAVLRDGDAVAIGRILLRYREVRPDG